MRHIYRRCVFHVGVYLACQLLALLTPMWGQSQTSALPRLVKFSGVVKDAQGKPQSGTVGVTFALYKDEQGGVPLWLETQNVQTDALGRYSVYLGATKSGGLPQDVFISGEARWLGVQPEGQAEQPRTLLLSVPYALKAGDAETVGGLPASAFVLAAAGNPASGNGVAELPAITETAVVSGSGTTNFVPLWATSTSLGNSVLFQSGSGNTAKLGVNTTTPAATLDVNGNVVSRGTLQLPSKGTATAGGGFNSQPFSLQGSAFNSGTQQAIGPLFQWQTEPSGNNTSNPAGTLNLLYGNGSGSPSETGLNIANNGRITFAAGQAFPGTGTITGVTTASGSGLTGGGTSGTLNLGLTNTCAANQVLQWNGSTWVCATVSGGGGTITGVTAGTDLTGGGTSGNVTLNVDTTKVVTGITAGTDLLGGGTGGVPTLSLDTTKVPQLNAANVFTGSQGINGNLTATGAVSGSSYVLGGATWGVGDVNNQNVFMGFAAPSSAGVRNTGIGAGALLQGGLGNDDTAVGTNALAFTQGSGNTAFGSGAMGKLFPTGSNNTAVGLDALALLTTGSSNTVQGTFALGQNQTGSHNTAIGNSALGVNVSGNFNTAVGDSALLGGSGFYITCVGYNCNVDTDHTNSTAIGANAKVTQDNSLILGSINGINTATADTNVGIGTTAPQTLLHMDHKPPFGGQDVLLLTTGGSSDVASLALQSTTSGGLRLREGVGTGTAYLSSTGGMEFITSDTGSPTFPSGKAMTIDTAGNVHIFGTLSKGGGSFQIDHPLDPANKYLYHSFVESPDMMNIYNGVATMDARGAAWITLPDYFEALNRDFRYQLTSMGRPQPELYIAKEISGSRFRIAGGKPGGRVSWQVTGIRQDAYANAHRIPVEVDKPAQEQGRYLHPELFGAPPELAIGAVPAAAGAGTR